MWTFSRFAVRGLTLPLLFMKKFLLWPALVVLLACPARAQTPSPTPTPESATVAATRNDWVNRVTANNEAAQARAKEIQIVFDGDSITDAWPRAGGGIWKERYAPLGAVCFGISGDRTQNVLWRLNNGQMDNLNPKLVLLMIGTNNFRSDSPEGIAAGVAAIVAEYRKRCPEAVIFVQGIFPRGQKADDPLRAKAKETNALIAKLADGKHVIYEDFGDKFLNEDGSMSKDVMPDFLHPAGKGYAIWAEAIQPVIDKYVPMSAATGGTPAAATP